MPAKAHIGVEEYLDLVFEDRPEPDYVDGQVVERALPDVAHSRLKGSLALAFAPLAKSTTLMTGLRVQIEPRLFRIVDFAIYLGARLEGRYADRPAFAMVEIVAPDDSFRAVIRRLEDYRRWGVPHIWVVDPQVKRLYEYSEAGLLQFPALRLAEFDFEVTAQELFKGI
jgi:Uma2 family endonuclease